MLPQVAIPHEQLAEFRRRWNISEFALFGSVLHDDFRPNSDVDVLVTSKPEVRITIRDLMAMEGELEAVLGRKVDLGDRKTVESDPNYIRRHAILNSLQVIYAE